MIPYDTKNYRARNNNLLSTSGYSVIGIVIIVTLLAWMDERDREAMVIRAQEAAVMKCS